MPKLTLTGFMLLSVLFFSNTSRPARVVQSKEKVPTGQSGTLQKMIVENGSVTMDLDLNRLNGISSARARPAEIAIRRCGQFLSSPFWFLTICCVALDSGSMALVLQDSPAAGVNAPGYSSCALAGSLNQLVVEKLPSGEAFDLAVRDSKTGSSFLTSKDTNTITMPMRSC